MTTQFTEENFEILFDEQNKVVEIRFQGINAIALAELSARVDGLETQLGTRIDGIEGSVFTVDLGLQSMNALLTTLTNDVNQDRLNRISGDELNTSELNALDLELTTALQNEINNRAQALLDEAAARNAAIMSATGTIVTDVAALATTVDGLATSMGAAQASIISISDALSTETDARAAQYSAIQADFANTNAAILNESVTRASDVDALAIQIDAIMATTSNNVFAQPDMPTTGMVTGDIWYDTDDGNRPYRYTGTAWVDVSDVRITNNAAAIITEQQARIDADNAEASLRQLLEARMDDAETDIGINTAAITAEHNAWVSADTAITQSVDSLSSTVALKNRVYRQTTAPTGTLTTGDVWFDTDDNNRPYYYTGTEWVLVDDARIAVNAAAIVTEQQARADGDDAVADSVTTLSASVATKITSHYQSGAPVPPLTVGDLWFDIDDNNRTYRWNGTVWTDIADSRIASALQTAGDAVTAAATAQATADGVVEIFYQPTAPVGAEGDLWFDTDDGNKSYRHDGAGWVVNQDAAIQQALTDASLAQVTADGKMTIYYNVTAPVTANEGDLWYDTDDGNHPYRRSGGSWLSIRDATISAASILASDALAAANDAQAAADGVVEIFYQTTPPTGALGDLWFDTDDGNKAYRHDGATWVLNQDTAIQTALTNAGLAQATADGKISAFYQTTAPATAEEGDLWYDTDDGNHPYTRLGAGWFSIRDATIAAASTLAGQALTAANTAQATADGVVEIFYQATAPVGAEGDLWFDTDDGNKPYRHNGTGWVLNQDQKAIDAFTNAGLAQATADGKIRSFYQTTAPTGMTAGDVGDLWFDIDDNNKLYYYNGSAWVLATDNRVTNMDSTIAAAVAVESSARANDIGEVEAKYGVKVTAAGHVAGFGLILNGNVFNGTVDSEFVIDATRFKVYNGSSGIVPFLVSGGVVYMQNVVIGDALIGSITVGKLTSGTFPNGQTFTHQGDINVGTTGRIRGAKTAFGVATAGFYLGYDSGLADYVLDIGDATRYMRWNGEKLSLTGLELKDSVLNNSVLGPSAARMVTSTAGHTAPFMVYDLTGIYQNATPVGDDFTLTVGQFLAPDYGTVGYDRKRFAFRKLDITYQINMGGTSGYVNFSIQARYENAGVWSGWTTLKSDSVQLDNRGSVHLFGRYTTNSTTYPSWGRMEFRVVTTNNNTIAIGLRVDILNTEESANTAGEHVLYESTTGVSRTSVLGATPTPPAWTRDPLWDNDKYLLD